MNLSTDMLVRVAREFMFNMAQPVDRLAEGQHLLKGEEVALLGAGAGAGAAGTLVEMAT